MTEFLKLLASLTNEVHDLLIELTGLLGFSYNDKQLHFIIVGIIGMIVFFIVHAVFKALSKISITAISFIYTFTVMVVFVFGIEIQQKITKRGRMEFEDITAGLWGFIEFFSIYAAIRLLIFVINKFLENLKDQDVKLNKKK
jgi:hypothetical protein